jgi:Phosphotransferase enzyme family
VSGADVAPILAAAERILSRERGRHVRLGHVERLSEGDRRNLLLRCRDLTGGSPPSFIIKKVVTDSYDPADTASFDTSRFFGDWSGAEFLSAILPAPKTPRYYGGDRDLGFFILEDLGVHRSLVEPLLDEDAASAERALLALSTCLGSVHAATIGGSAAFETVLRGRGSRAQIFAPPLTGLRERLTLLEGNLEAMGIRPANGFCLEVAAVIDAVERPGPFFSYVHGDACPDNVFWNGEDLRLIDFEFGGFGHALADAAYGRMLFPSCWCANRLAADLVSRMEAAYRVELVKGCPEAQEDRIFDTALAAVCGFWLLSSLSRHLAGAIEADRTWGIATIRQRVLARLEAFITTAQEFDRLPAMRGTASRLLEQLRGEWPDLPPLPLYPAFQRPSDAVRSVP